ncbi:MAG: type IV secretory system conjugative DNA transfer family protein [Lachnospiraceae bacterium]|nr:type IV secretory system conjugative DNA transfer family protein [Lachnospiraceae bacterium]
MNRQLTQNIYMSMNTRRTDLNNNITVVGGSGAGKSFRLARPILMSMAGSYICTDPKGELARSMGKYLEDRGYDVKVLNLLNIHGMKKSVRYNPLDYIRNDMDVVKLATNIMANTAVKDAKSNDPFFDEAAGKLLQALIYYTVEVHKNNPVKKNFRTVMELLAMADFEIDPDTMSKKESDLDIMFSDLEEKENRRMMEERRQGKIPKPMSNAVIKYNSIMRGAADTVRSIVITLDNRLSNMHIEELLDLLSEDEINIPDIGMGKNLDGKTKTALFLVIPDNDKSFNFIIGMLYTQIIQELYYQADIICDGELPISVTFLMDEFANVALPDDFDSVLSTERSRNMNSIIILQNMAQIKAMYEKKWENITGNCDTFIYLGGNEQSTHEYVSKMLGKGTFDKRTFGETKGRQGSSSRNYDVVGRELMLPEEVRKMNKRKCLVLIRGYDPVIDFKIRTEKHPLFKYINNVRYEFDRLKHRKGGMYFASENCVKVKKREEEIEGTKKIIEIDGDALMQLSSESINAYTDSGWYEELTEDLLEIQLEQTKQKEKEIQKNMPVTDEEISSMNPADAGNFLMLRSEGYTDRQIKALTKIIKSGKSLDETMKMFPKGMEAERIEQLSAAVIQKENGGNKNEE